MKPDRVFKIAEMADSGKVKVKHVAELVREIGRLRHIISAMGERHDECTYFDLKIVCTGCRCPKRPA